MRNFLFLSLSFLAIRGSYNAGYRTNAASTPYQAQFHQNSVPQWAQKVGGYPQPQQQIMPAGPGSPQVFVDTMGSEVEMEWERCVDSLIQAPDQMAQLDQMGDPHTLEKLLKEDRSTTYTYRFKDGSTVVFLEKPGFTPEMMSVDFGTPNMVQPGFGSGTNQDPNYGASLNRPIKPGYQPHSAVAMHPSYFQNCASCVTNNFVWAGGNCVENCNVVADTSCWKHLKGCETEQKQQKEIESCQLATDCMTCVDSGESCVWDHTSCFSTIPLYFQPHDVINRERDCLAPIQPGAPLSPGAPVHSMPAQMPGMQAVPAQPMPMQPVQPVPMQPVQPPPMSGVPMPGGWTSGMNQQNMKSKWNEVLAKNSNSAMTSVSDLQALNEPISVETQVVAGVNYKFKFQDGTEVIVLEQIWMNILTITNIIPPSQGMRLKSTHKRTHSSKNENLGDLSLILAVVGGLLVGVLVALLRESWVKKESKDVYIDLSMDCQQRKV